MEAFSANARAAFRRGENETVAELSRQEVRRAQAAGDPGAEIEALYMLSRTAIRAEDLDEARRVASAALEVALRTGKQELEERPRHVLAAVARMSGDLPLARELYLKSIELNTELGRPESVTSEYHNLSITELHLGHTERARELITEVRERVFRDGYDDFVPYVCVAATVLAVADRDYSRVALLLGVTASAFQAVGQVPDPDDAAELETARKQALAAIAEDAFAAEYDRGTLLAPAVVLA